MTVDLYFFKSILDIFFMDLEVLKQPPLKSAVLSSYSRQTGLALAALSVFYFPLSTSSPTGSQNTFCTIPMCNLVSYWLNAMTLPVSNGGGSSSRCHGIRAIT
jgi:hypothetical protein